MAEPEADQRRLRVEGLGALQAPKRRQRDALLVRQRDRWADLDAEAGAILVDDDPPDLLAEVSAGIRFGRLLGHFFPPKRKHTGPPAEASGLFARAGDVASGYLAGATT